MDCDTYHELIVADLDGTLGANEREAVHAHLDECTVCRNARALEAEFAAYLRRGPRLFEAPPAVQERLRAALSHAAIAPRRRASLPVLAVVATLLVGAALGIWLLL